MFASLISLALVCSWFSFAPNRHLYGGLAALKGHLGVNHGFINSNYTDIQGVETASASLFEQAQQIDRADDYLPHFRNVLQLPNIENIEHAASTCKWDDIDRVDFQYGWDTPWNQNPVSSDVIATRRSRWQDFVLKDMIPWSKVANRFHGRGIVVLAGNTESLPRARVLLRALRSLHSKLPVELAFMGDEMSEETRVEMLSVHPSVHFLDLNDTNAAWPTYRNYFIANFHFKNAALLNSRFTDILFLDSDNIPVEDPDLLFESLTYKKFGTVFWPDIARTRPVNPAWAITNTPCRADEYEMESGQLLVNKARFWYHLQLATFLGHEDYMGEILLGDKDTFRFAWHALKTEYGRPARWLTSIGTVFRPRNQVPFPEPLGRRKSKRTGDRPSTSTSSMASNKLGTTPEQGYGVYCGHSFGQHHPDATTKSRVFFLHGGSLKTYANPVMRHALEYSGGVFSAYKDSPESTDPGFVERVGIRYDGANFLEKADHDTLEKPAACVDMFDVIPQPLGDEHTRELAGIEQKLIDYGIFWVLKDPAHGG